MLELVVKSVALFYLLQAAFTSLTSLVAMRLVIFIPSTLKIRFITAVHTVAFIFALSITVAMAILSKTGLIVMTTSYFMALMTGPGEMGIIIAGWVGLILSLFTSYLFFQLGASPALNANRIADRFKSLPVIVTDKIAFSALFGIFRPFIALSPNIHTSERELALIHEYTHYRLKHNLIKLFFRMLLRLNMFNLPLHRIVKSVDLMCEYECDSKASLEFGRDKYIQTLLTMLDDVQRTDKTKQIGIALRESADDSINSREKAAGSLLARFKSLSAVATMANDGKDTFVITVAYIVAFAPVIVISAYIFLSSTPRCAVICFLGY